MRWMRMKDLNSTTPSTKAERTTMRLKTTTSLHREKTPISQLCSKLLMTTQMNSQSNKSTSCKICSRSTHDQELDSSLTSSHLWTLIVSSRQMASFKCTSSRLQSTIAPSWGLPTSHPSVAVVPSPPAVRESYRQLLNMSIEGTKTSISKLLMLMNSSAWSCSAKDWQYCSRSYSSGVPQPSLDCCRTQLRLRVSRLHRSQRKGSRTCRHSRHMLSCHRSKRMKTSMKRRMRKVRSIPPLCLTKRLSTLWAIL